MQLAEMAPEQGHGVTPRADAADRRAVAADLHNFSAGKDGQAYQVLWRRLSCCFSGAPTAARSLGLTSCARGEGVSTVAARLAVTAATAGQPVLLVDANLGAPSLHRLFQLNPGPGFAEALQGEGPCLEFIQPTPVPDLSVLVAGQLDGASAPAHESAAMAAAITALKRAFPLIVFDLPAVAQGSFTARLAGLLDGVLLVVEAECIRWKVVQREKELLAQAGAPLLGAVLNKRRRYVPAWLSRFL